MNQVTNPNPVYSHATILGNDRFFPIYHLTAICIVKLLTASFNKTDTLEPYVTRTFKRKVFPHLQLILKQDIHTPYYTSLISIYKVFKFNFNSIIQVNGVKQDRSCINPFITLFKMQVGINTNQGFILIAVDLLVCTAPLYRRKRFKGIVNFTSIIESLERRRVSEH
jgi:hypothetical protein